MENINGLFTNSDHFEIRIDGYKLTPREVDVVSCIINSGKVPSIATLLSISSRTAETHIKNIMLKLKCSSQKDIFNLFAKSEYFKLLNRHYFKLNIRLLFERQLKKYLAGFNKNPFVFYNRLYRKTGIWIFLKNICRL